MRTKSFAFLAALALGAHCIGATDDYADIKAEITKRHDEAVKRLQDWIAQVSIAAENRGYPEGAEYMAKLARDAGTHARNYHARPGRGAHGRHRDRELHWRRKPCHPSPDPCLPGGRRETAACGV